jgi:hypothetical protein
VAQDDRLARPAWLTSQFEPTDMSVTVSGRLMKVFQNKASQDESLTLGSNTDSTGTGEAAMYLVFIGSSQEARR